jgi:hypothetical protein
MHVASQTSSHKKFAPITRRFTAEGKTTGDPASDGQKSGTATPPDRPCSAAQNLLFPLGSCGILTANAPDGINLWCRQSHSGAPIAPRGTKKQSEFESACGNVATRAGLPDHMKMCEERYCRSKRKDCVMRTRNWNVKLESDAEQGDTLVEQNESTRNEYRRGRAVRTSKRRSSRRAGSQPELGMSARRNRRWSW